MTTTFIDEKVREGRYASASDVIRAGLRLLEEEEAKLARLKELIAEGKLHGTIRFHGTPAEESVGGKLYMIKVTPPHGTPYYLVDPKGDGGFVREDLGVGDRGISVPMWVIKTF